MTGDRSELTLQHLGPIEGLLFLEKEGVAHKRQSAHSLAVSSIRPIVSSAVDGKFIMLVSQ